MRGRAYLRSVKFFVRGSSDKIAECLKTLRTAKRPARNNFEQVRLHAIEPSANNR